MHGHPALVAQAVEGEQHGVLADGLALANGAGQQQGAVAGVDGQLIEQAQHLAREGHQAVFAHLHAGGLDLPQGARAAVELGPGGAAQFVGAHEGVGGELQAQAGDEVGVGGDMAQQLPGIAGGHAGVVPDLLGPEHTGEPGGGVFVDLAAVLGVVEDLREALGHAVGGFLAAGGVELFDDADQGGAVDLVEPLVADDGVDVVAQGAGYEQLVFALLDRAQVMGHPDLGPVGKEGHRAGCSGLCGRGKGGAVGHVRGARFGDAERRPEAVGFGFGLGAATRAGGHQVVVPP